MKNSKENSLTLQALVLLLYVKAVREYLRVKTIVLADYKSAFKIKAWFYIEKGNESVQSVLARSETITAAVGRWNELFDELNWLIN